MVFLVPSNVLSSNLRRVDSPRNINVHTQTGKENLGNRQTQTKTYLRLLVDKHFANFTSNQSLAAPRRAIKQDAAYVHQPHFVQDGRRVDAGGESAAKDVAEFAV